MSCASVKNAVAASEGWKGGSSSKYYTVKSCFDKFGYLSFLYIYLFRIIKYSGVPLPALHSNSDQTFQNISKCHGRMLC